MGEYSVHSSRVGRVLRVPPFSTFFMVGLVELGPPYSSKFNQTSRAKTRDRRAGDGRPSSSGRWRSRCGNSRGLTVRPRHQPVSIRSGPQRRTIRCCRPAKENCPPTMGTWCPPPGSRTGCVSNRNGRGWNKGNVRDPWPTPLFPTDPAQDQRRIVAGQLGLGVGNQPYPHDAGVPQAIAEPIDQAR